MFKSVFKALLISYSICNAAIAQQILQRSVLKGFAMDIKQLEDKSYFVPCTFVKENSFQVKDYVLDKKLGERSSFDEKRDAFIYHNGIVLGDQHTFYVNSYLLQPLGGGTAISLKGAGIAKYDENGKELWFKSLQQANNDSRQSVSSLAFVNDSLKYLYVDTLGMLSLLTLTKEGDSITTVALNKECSGNIFLAPFQSNKLVSLCRNDSLETRNSGKVSVQILDYNGKSLVDKKQFADSMNSYCGNMEVINDFIFLGLFTQDTPSLSTRHYIVKLDSNGNIVGNVYLGKFSNVAGIAAMAVSKDGALYIGMSSGVVYKYDTNLNRKWSYSFDTAIYGLDSAGCNGVGLVKFYGNTAQYYQSEVIIFRDPDLQDVCSRCEVNAFPNPTTDGVITFRSHHPDVFISKTEWYDNAGRYVWSMTGESDELRLNANQLSAGEYYTISTCDNDKIAHRRIIIAR